MSIIGIDPGITGAIALLDDGHAVRVLDMPAFVVRKKRKVSGLVLHDQLLQMKDGGAETVYIEDVSARPGQGVTSMFSFGYSLGVAEGVVTALKLPLIRVRPTAWKRRAGLVGCPKDASRGLAIEMFPNLAEDLSRKKDCGRADALLIAYFGATNN